MTQFSLGYRTLCEAIGNGESAADAMQKLAHCANHSATADIFSGAVSCVLSVFQNIKASGVSLPNFEAQHLNQFMKQPSATMATTLSANLTLRHKDVDQQLGALCCVVDQHRGNISFNERPAANVVEKPAEPIKSSGPIEVVVIGMVTRKTTTEIHRNAHGQIESSAQVEWDA